MPQLRAFACPLQKTFLTVTQCLTYETAPKSGDRFDEGVFRDRPTQQDAAASSPGRRRCACADGGALPTAWAEPGEEATNQDAGAEAVDAEGAVGGEDLLVTIPGNHNKVMGCDADWAPDCAKAALTRDATGVYTATFTLPAGDYEYKVAEGGSWDASYVKGEQPGERTSHTL